MKSLKLFYHRHEMTVPRIFESLVFLIFVPLAFLGMFLFSYGVLLPWITAKRIGRNLRGLPQQTAGGELPSASR